MPIHTYPFCFYCHGHVVARCRRIDASVNRWDVHGGRAGGWQADHEAPKADQSHLYTGGTSNAQGLGCSVSKSTRVR